MEPLIFRPGVNTELSQTLNMGGLSASNLIRTRMGLPEKIGGWMRLSNATVLGAARRMHAWADLSGIDYLAIGSNEALEVFVGNVLSDITPIRRTVNLANPLAVTVGSSLVTVTDTSNGVAVGDSVNIPIPTAIGFSGLLLFGRYTVVNVIDGNTYQIDAGSLSTANVPAGGSVPVFTTTNTQVQVTVTLAANNFPVNSIFTVQASTSVGGMTLLGDFIITTIIDADNFLINGPTSATSTTSASENSGNVRIQYYIAPGPQSNIALSGWGSGTWGLGAWGSGGAGGIAPLRNWSLDNFGQNLVAVPTNGSLYQWVPPPAPGNSATLVSQAPTPNTAMFVQMAQAQVVLLGSSVMGVQDPMLIAWCDAGDITDWTASVSNQAGTYRLSRGSKIVGGMQSPFAAMIWTDVGLWTMTYIQPPLVYSFNEVAQGCGLIAQNARCILNQVVYWVSQKGFFALDGQGIHPVDCPVWDMVFKDLDTTQIQKAHLAPNSNFNELMFFYASQSGGLGEVDSYVKLNVLDKTWDFGSLVRLSWVDQSVWGPPIGIDGVDGLMQQHETSVDADGAPMSDVSLITGYADLDNGENYVFIHQIIPDFVWRGSASEGVKSVTVTLFLVDYPADAEPAGVGIGTIGPFVVTSATQYITIQKRARQIAMKIESDGFGTQWRLGKFRVKQQRDGQL